MTATLARDKTEEHVDCLSWRAHPARERPVAALLAVGVIGATVLACAALASIVWGLLAAVVLVVSLNRFFWPSRFTIDQDGVMARYAFRRQTLHWSEVRRFCHDRYGIYLSTRSRRSRLDPYRGMHLLFGSSRQQVLRVVEARLAANGESPWGG